jgi:hypothetical protein
MGRCGKVGGMMKVKRAGGAFFREAAEGQGRFRRLGRQSQGIQPLALDAGMGMRILPPGILMPMP